MLAAALTACATKNTQLNSERIEKKFGNYHIDVLEGDALVQRSNLYSINDAIAVCRTYAVVQFIAADDPYLGNEHRHTIDGGSMGATFKSAGWNIIKKTLHIGALSIADADAKILQLMRSPTTQELAFHIYQLTVAKGDIEIEYAVIAELHHPDYLREADLREIYAAASESAIDENYVNEIATLVLP